LNDCVNAALYLARERKVDRDRLAIRGGSAGGIYNALRYHVP
jgi:dipeptidyl aminopeptidase/acylaminoacyl peptidase